MTNPTRALRNAKEITEEKKGGALQEAATKEKNGETNDVTEEDQT